MKRVMARERVTGHVWRMIGEGGSEEEDHDKDENGKGSVCVTCVLSSPWLTSEREVVAPSSLPRLPEST